MSLDLWIIVMLFLVLVVLVWNGFMYHDTKEMCLAVNYTTSVYEGTLQGIYDPRTDIVCVRAEDYLSDREVEFHEVCHHLVDNDYYHFCDEYYD